MNVKQIQGKYVDLYLTDTARVRKNRYIFRNSRVLLEFVNVVEKVLFDRKGNFYLKKDKVNKIEFHVQLCGRSKIKSLNYNYRKKSKVTDVLSFQIHDQLNGKSSSYQSLDGYINLGDIFIYKGQAKSQAKIHNIDYDSEVIHLMIHGLLHLLGFDHEKSLQAEKDMLKYEKLIIDKLRLKL